MSATGVATLSSPNLSFTAAAGAWAEARSVLVTNTREGPLGISSWEVRQGYGYNGFYVSGSTCPEELEPGASCEVSVRPQV